MLLTLAIVHQGDQVLLGMKKTGFGAGRWNGFGGKVKPGEEIEAAAKRELFEESGLQVEDWFKIGILYFSWQTKPEEILETHLFKVLKYNGELIESDEMKPQWFNTDEIPFDRMWHDDHYWFDYFLTDKKFEAAFVFNDQDQVIKYNLKEIK